jgi:hypothetical protein
MAGVLLDALTNKAAVPVKTTILLMQIRKRLVKLGNLHVTTWITHIMRFFSPGVSPLITLRTQPMILPKILRFFLVSFFVAYGLF